MRIKNIETILLTGPCTDDPYLSAARKLRSAAFVRIWTADGLSGLGETYGGYFLPEAVPSIVDFFKPILIGKTIDTADSIQQIWKQMYHAGNFWCRVGLGAIVMTAIEAALWDLNGKARGKPVYQLLREAYLPQFREGTDRPGVDFAKLPCYATGGPSNYPKNKLADKIAYYQSLGFNGIKIGAGAFEENKGHTIATEPEAAADFEAEKLQFIREQFGNDLRVMLDAHMGNHSAATWNLQTALAVAKAVAPFQLFFLEEPLHYTRPDWYTAISKDSPTPIAGGECLTAPAEWQTYIDQDCFQIGQPDAAFVSGLGPFMEIAAALGRRGQKIAPHAWGAGAAQMQNIHAGFAAPNTLILEVAPNYGPLHRELIGDNLILKDGYILPPDAPGLGIELSAATIKRFPFIPGSGEFNSVPGKILNT